MATRTKPSRAAVYSCAGKATLGVIVPVTCEVPASFSRRIVG
jgi:hypothetical protein